MLCDAEGRPYAEATYPDELTSEAMLKEIASAQKVKAERDAMFAKAEKAEGMDKAKLLVAALKLVPEAAVPITYGATVEEIARLDPEDTLKFSKAAQMAAKLVKLEAGFSEFFEAKKFGEGVASIDAFIKAEQPEGEAKQKALMFKFYGHAGKEDFDTAAKVIEEILRIDENTDTAALAKQLKRQIENR